MSKLGATGIAMPLSEVMPALQVQGTIDGTISGMSVFVEFKMNNLVKVISVTNYDAVSLAVVSQAWLDKLPPDLQKIVLDTAQAIQPRCKPGRWNSPRSWRTIG